MLDERLRQRELMRRKRATARDLVIPPVRNERRRRRAAADPSLWLRTYFPHIYANPFTPPQLAQLRAICTRAEVGGYQAVAGPRGDGKTSIAQGAGLYLTMHGRAEFAVLVNATGRDADARLANVRHELESNGLLALDYPEICIPIRALEGWASRANMQTVNGQRTRLVWKPDLLILPTIAGSAASGRIFTTRGVDAAIVGLNVRGKRPDLVILDDLETRESVYSPTVTDRIEKTILEDILGLAPPGGGLAVAMLCTVKRRDCIADRYTDPQREPAWSGMRFALLEGEPTNTALWDQYIEARRRDQIEGDPTGRTAHRLYMEHRQQMDAGAVVSNPYRYDNRELPDGSHLQSSTLERCYCLIADNGRDAFDTEFQNRPPAEEVPTAEGPTLVSVQRACNGHPQGAVPPQPDYLTAGIDIGGRVLHWVVAAWRAGVGSIIDYGTQRVLSPLEGSITAEANIEATREAILTALLEWRDKADSGWPEIGSGEVRRLDAVCVDAAWQPDPVAEFVRSRPDQLLATKGFGTGSGQARYRPPAGRGHGRRVGPHWHATRQPRQRYWLHHLDADAMKHLVHGGFSAPAGKPGSLTLFGDNPAVHRNYAQHIVAEQWTTQFIPGKGSRSWWDQRSAHNHWLDATALAEAAAIIRGMAAVASRPEAAKPAPQAPGRTKARRSMRRAIQEANR